MKKQKTFPYQLTQYFFSTKQYSSPRILNTHPAPQLSRLSKSETLTQTSNAHIYSQLPTKYNRQPISISLEHHTSHLKTVYSTELSN